MKKIFFRHFLKNFRFLTLFQNILPKTELPKMHFLYAASSHSGHSGLRISKK